MRNLYTRTFHKFKLMKKFMLFFFLYENDIDDSYKCIILQILSFLNSLVLLKHNLLLHSNFVS